MNREMRYFDTDKMLEDIQNELNSDNYWTENEYSNDPDYSEIDKDFFEYFERLEKTLELQKIVKDRYEFEGII